MRYPLLLDISIAFVFFYSLIDVVVAEMIATRDPVTLFLAGDVMIGRGIDQVLPHPGDPALYESYVKDARDYVALAEILHGPIQQPVQCAAIWGDALQELERFQPDVRLINLETTITTSNDFWKGKGIHYKMHPQNVSCLTVARIDHCSLANNHILDWGYAGLTETLATLQQANINASGAGQDLLQAGNPAIMVLNDNRRVIIFSYGLRSSGIPNQWAAREDRPGVNFLLRLSRYDSVYQEQSR